MSMYIHDNMTTELNRRSFMIKPVSNNNITEPIVGVIKEETFSYSLKQDMGRGGQGGLLGALGDKFLKNNPIVSQIFESVSGESDISSMTEVYSVKAPKTFANPSFSFTAVFYQGLQVLGTRIGTYSQFQGLIGKYMLPKTNQMGIGSVLTTNQTDWKTYTKLLTTGTLLSEKQQSVGCSLKFGSFFSAPTGFWLSGAEITAKLLLDNKGLPVIWECRFELEYYKQITVAEWTSWWK